MEISQVETLYTSVCPSQRENNIKTCKDYLLFSSNRCPVIYETHRRLAIHLLGHTDEVNGTCFIEDISDSTSSSDTTHLISTSYDKSAIIWEIRKTSEAANLGYRILHKFNSQTKECFSTRSCILKGDKFLSVTTSVDGNLSLWLDDKLIHTTTIKYCCFDSVIHQVDGYLLLFLAGADNKVHIFQITDDQLKYLINLVGHQDWIKSLDILNLEFPNEVLLASASQDLYVRIWHLRVEESKNIHQDSKHLRTNSSCELETKTSSGTISSTYKLTVTLETVLSGHEGIVHGVCWFKRQPKPLLQLVSCSSDKTVIIWKSTFARRYLKPVESGNRDKNDDDNSDSLNKDDNQKRKRFQEESVSAEIWKEVQRMGETGETNLPFLSVCLSPDESILYGQSLHGAIHSWTKGVNEQWVLSTSITGHFGPITDLSWEQSGSYLLSCSLDKTCRLHSVAKRDTLWHELTRPQVHGHELNCIASLGFMKFASGAEEKTIRVFEATQFFMRNFRALSDNTDSLAALDLSQISLLPNHAQLPALGLSNRGAKTPYDMDNSDGDKANSMASNWYKSSKLVEQLSNIEHLSELPQEEVLLQSTLWWEANKLYGHGNELYALAVDPTASFIASASKANRAELAEILIWDVGKFRKVATIQHHTLTVTKLRFSPDAKYLLSVSRDRTWCVSVKTGQLRDAYKKLVGTTKSNSSHDRIIWDCCWTPDSRYFMTVSRDQKAILWSMSALEVSMVNEGEEKIDPVSSKLFNASIQAVDCCNFPSSTTQTCYLFALGLEDGSLELCGIVMNSSGEDHQWHQLKSFTYFHHMPIRRLTFQPSLPLSLNSNGACSVCLASAADDCMVKLTRFVLRWVA